MKTKERLNNSYVRDYYNQTVAKMSDGYTKNRWFSTEVGKFDFTQTKRALEKALGDNQYQSVLEIGPGSAVWTEIIMKNLKGHIHLIEQSDEMLAQAKSKLKDKTNVTFERSDFLYSKEQNNVDLIVSLRCFEYFEDKKSATEKIFKSLTSGGKFVLVTKNSEMLTTTGVQSRVVHSDQLNKKQVIHLLKSVGFNINYVYPATIRWKVKYAPMRWFFDMVHKLSVSTNGKFRIPFIEKYSTESYIYIATKS